MGRAVVSAGLEEARRLLRRASRVVVLTGAGISAESGVPTFRGPMGLWRTYRPEDLATPEAFERDPCLLWEWYLWRRGIVGACRPNAAHLALARFALQPGRDVTILTQNVDGLHTAAAREAAGPREPPRALPLELHGALFRDRCSGCGVRSDALADVDASSVGALPRCGTCGSLLRPDVVWFGELLDAEVVARAFRSASRAEVCLAVGTSGLVHPAASIPVATRSAGGVVVEVNPDRTPLTPIARHALRGSAAEVVPVLVGDVAGGASGA